MLYIEKITSGNPFEKYPQLNHIWPPLSQSIVKEATLDSIAYKEDGVYLIKKDNEVIGLTGFFMDNEQLCLRWHGFAKEHRGKGYSSKVLVQVLQEAKKHHPDKTSVSEFVPLTDYCEPIIEHFEHMGFKKYGPTEIVDWRPEPLQEYRADIDTFLKRYLLQEIKSIKLKM